MSLPYKAKVNSLTNKKGVKISLSGCLLDGYGIPRNGWGCNINIKGSFIAIKGKNPVEVFLGLKRLLTLNNVEFTDEDCWLNLNIIWFKATNGKHHTVELTALLENAIPVEGETMDMTHRVYPPTVWGRHAWNFMGCYLSGDAYKWETFRSILGIVSGMLDPTTNPSIGDGEAYLSLLIELENFDRHHTRKLFTRESARNWLVDYHNSVNVRLGKQKVSYDTAATNYLWK